MARLPSRDPKLDQMIVSHLRELEGASQYTSDVLEPAILAEMEGLVSSFCRSQNWENLWANDQWALAPKEWKRPGSPKGSFPVNFAFGYIMNADSQEDTFFLTSLLWLNEVRMGFYWTRPALGKQKWRLLLDQHPNFLDALRELGWEYDAKDTSLYLPVKIEQNAISEGLSTDDLAEALKPFAEALPRLQQSQTLFAPMLAATDAD